MVLFLLPATLAILCLTTSTRAAANICFLPNGQRSQDVPCDSTAEVSMCCGSKQACLSSGLCKDTSTNSTAGVSYARGTCTDQTWTSPICPQHCVINQDQGVIEGAFDFRENGVQAWQCDPLGGFAKPGPYCCESAAEKSRCCSTATAIFSLPAATPGNALAVQTFPAPFSTIPTGASSPPPASSTSSAASATSTAAVPSSTPSASSSAAETGSTTPIQNALGAAATVTISTGLGSTTLVTSSKPKTKPTPTTSSRSLAIITPTSIIRTSSTSTPTTEASASSTAQTLNTGSIVAVGMGASVAGAGIVAMAVFFLARRKARQTEVNYNNKQQFRQSFTSTTSSHQGPPPPPPLGAYDASAGGAYARAFEAYANVGRGDPPKLQQKLGTGLWMAEKGIYEAPLNHPSIQRVGPSELEDMSPVEGDRSSLSTGTWRLDATGKSTWSNDVDAPLRSPGMKQKIKAVKVQSIYELP